MFASLVRRRMLSSHPRDDKPYWMTQSAGALRPPRCADLQNFSPLLIRGSVINPRKTYSLSADLLYTWHDASTDNDFFSQVCDFTGLPIKRRPKLRRILKYDSLQVCTQYRPHEVSAMGWHITPKWAWSGSCDPLLNFGDPYHLWKVGTSNLVFRPIVMNSIM